MIRFSNCKINIGLDVTRRRADGYHDLVTAMVQVPWHDVIEILPASESNRTAATLACGQNSLTVLGRKVDCPPEKNLVMKAVAAMQQKYNVPPVDVILQKNIPDGAGLGGGSGDASATILLLNDLFSLGLSKEQMHAVAATLGADCPIFIYDGPMLATGTGTTLQPIELPQISGLFLAIAKPEGVSISTKEAYAAIKPAIPDQDLSESLKLPISDWMRFVKNDFEPGIFALAQSVRVTKETMIANGAAYAAMSGSGAAVFGLFASKSDAEKALKLLSDHTTFLTQIK